MRPKRTKGKADPAATRAFALLLQAMKSRKVAALVKLAMRGPARFALLTPEGNLLLILTADAIREPVEVDRDFKFTAQELTLATTLIDMVGVDTPVVIDDTAPVVQAAVNDKAKGVPAPAKQDTPAIPSDIMAALEASIAARKEAAA